MQKTIFIEKFSIENYCYRKILHRLLSFVGKFLQQIKFFKKFIHRKSWLSSNFIQKKKKCRYRKIFRKIDKFIDKLSIEHFIYL